MSDRMSEYMPERMPGRISEYIYIYAMNTSRWYVKNYVGIVCKGGDHSKQSNFNDAHTFHAGIHVVVSCRQKSLSSVLPVK